MEKKEYKKGVLAQDNGLEKKNVSKMTTNHLKAREEVTLEIS